jgi:thiol-disulfide isomerase/thioredoxin
MDQNEIRETIETKEASAAEAVTEAAEAGDKKKKKKKGGCLKVGLIILLVLVLLIAAAIFIFYEVYKDKVTAAQAERNKTTYTGREMPDFEATTTDGETVSLGSLMDGKEVTVVVLFATWCGPCEKEFPEMDAVYQKYQDKMSMIGLDVDKMDSEESAKEYADSHGLAFPIAYFPEGSIGDIRATAYPTTLVIDRNGKIGMHRVGSVPDAATFEKIVTQFMGDDYQETQVGYYTFAGMPGTEFSLTDEDGNESTYTVGDDSRCDVFTDKPHDFKVKVLNVPGGKIDGEGELQSGIGSTVIMLPVKK